MSTSRSTAPVLAPPLAGSEAEGVTGELPPATLLLVDDRRENLIALVAVLEPLGYNLVQARSGAEALKQCLTHDFAVILLDVQMPDMDGFETAALIKQREKSRYIPIIFVTAINTDEKHVFHGYQSGAVDYLAKPIDADMLRSKVTVFADMYQQRQIIEQQAHALREATVREARRQYEEQERERERQHTARLAEREAQLGQFKATLDATLDAVFLFDAETLKFFYVNQGALNLTGYSEVELLGHTPLETATLGGEADLHPLLASARAGGGASVYEAPCRHKSGRLFPTEVRTQYIAPPDGGAARFVSIVRDISERKRADERLARMYEREKRIAEALQQSIVFAPPEDLFPGLTIATLYQAAWDEASVGGDYLDVFALQEGKVALVVGDVSGKGLAAAARTAEVKYALRAYLRDVSDPARALTRLNTFVCETAPADGGEADEFPSLGQFICISLAIVDAQTGEVTFAVAGAEPPLIFGGSGGARPMETRGLPVGVSPDEVYVSATVTLEKGEMVALVTDGITEARKGREFFGYDGFTHAAEGAVGLGTPQQTCKAILDGARQFAGGQLQDDACLLLAARY